MAGSLAAQIVIVVPAKSPVDSLSTKTLQKIFKGQPVEKGDGRLFQIVEFSSVSDEFYKKLYNLDAYAIGKHWLRLIFSGERVLPPKNFSAMNKFMKCLLSKGNTIGFLSAEEFKINKSDSVRAVVIDGHNFLDPNYTFKKNIKTKKKSNKH
ncbi:MAG: hypothetical protein ACE5HS_06145 [bacterium]